MDINNNNIDYCKFKNNAIEQMIDFTQLEWDNEVWNQAVEN
jgi:hypothetical protein